MSVTQDARPPAGKDSAARVAARALENAFAQHQGELLGTLYYLVGNLEDARDALQDAFMKCWRHQEQLPEIENLKAWIFRVALNAGRDIRETAWRRKRQGLPEDESALASRDAGPDDSLVRHARGRPLDARLCAVHIGPELQPDGHPHRA